MLLFNPSSASMSLLPSKTAKDSTAACYRTSSISSGRSCPPLVAVDLLTASSSWLPRIPFTLLFGVATSVDLLQARLLSSTVQFIYGAQFDVVQSSTILERIFRTAVAGANVPLRFGPGLLQSLLDRQRDHAAGIQVFVNSLKVRRALLQYVDHGRLTRAVRVYVSLLRQPTQRLCRGQRESGYNTA